MCVFTPFPLLHHLCYITLSLIRAIITFNTSQKMNVTSHVLTACQMTITFTHICVRSYSGFYGQACHKQSVL